MKYYTPNRQISTKARDVMLRILFVIIAAAVITFGTILIGHHLLNKVEALGERPTEMSGTGWTDERREEDPLQRISRAEQRLTLSPEEEEYHSAEEEEAPEQKPARKKE